MPRCVVRDRPGQLRRSRPPVLLLLLLLLALLATRLAAVDGAARLRRGLGLGQHLGGGGLLASRLAAARSAWPNSITDAEKETAMKNSQMNPPWQATQPGNSLPMGLPGWQAGELAKAGTTYTGPYASGAHMASLQNYIPQSPPPGQPVYGPNFGIGGSVANLPAAQVPRWYPEDVLSKPEPRTVTPPFMHVPGEMEPVHPVPCSTQDSQGTGWCNDASKPAKDPVTVMKEAAKRGLGSLFK